MGLAIMDKEEQKRTKKEKKAKRTSEDTGAVSVANGSAEKKKRKTEVAGGTTTTTLTKKKKKEKKQIEEEPQAVEALPEASNGKHEDTDKKKKKKKKEKAEGAGSASSVGTGMAEVGDRQLAAERPKLIKCLYQESPAVTKQTSAEVEVWREERSITLENATTRPITAFDQTGLTSAQLHAVRRFTAPSPIQAQCLPLALSGRDLVGIAATGSGKTLAFGLPALAHIAAQVSHGIASGKKPIALVVAPTRELAVQISTVLKEAGQTCGVSVSCLYGGVPRREQIGELRRGAQIVVATPGRLEDLVQDGACALDEVSYLVLDEADRMLDMGFEPHMRAIASKTRADRQTLMFSATWPNVIRKLAAEFLASPARVVIGSQDLAASHSVRQIVEVIEDRARFARLDELLRTYHKSRTNRVIVFVLYKKEASRVEAQLQQHGWNAAAVHGDISQAQRSAAVDAFKAGTVPVLVATDVAARGLDIPDVEVVINFSFPLTTEDYVHRIGRTGRAGKRGIAHTMFVGANDKQRAGELINVLKEASQEVPEELYKFGTAVKKKESKVYGAFFKDVDLTKKATKISFDSDDE